MKKPGIFQYAVLCFLLTNIHSSFSQNNATPLDSALIACYNFSGNANDNSGNGNNGTVNGAVLVNDRFGAANSAYSFNGQNQNIVIPGFSSQVPSNNFSISFWATASVAATRSAFLMSPDDDYNRLNIHIYYVGSIYWDFGSIYASGRLYSSQGGLPPANTWDHWVFTVGSANGGFMKIYKNGTLFATQNGTSSYSNAQLKNLMIGGGVGVNDSYLWFGGKLDDIRIYKRVLIQNDVSALYTTTTLCNQCTAVSAPVNSTPANLLNICSGQSTSLFATSSNSVTWYYAGNMNNSVGTGTTFVTPALGPGTYTYCAIASSSCASSGTTSFVIMVKPVPVVSITGAVNLCSGSATSLFANVNANGNIYWYDSPLLNTVVGIGNNFVTPALNAGIYNYYVLTDALCASNIPVTMVVNVDPMPVLSFAVANPVICIGQNTTLNVTGATNYSWNNGSTGPAIVVSPTVNTTYTVTGNTNGCASAASVQVVVSKCTGVSEIAGSNNGMSIYPNPTNGEFILDKGSFAEGTTVTIYNPLGKLIQTVKIKEQKTSFDLHGFAKGVYILKIMKEDKELGYSKLILE